MRVYRLLAIALAAAFLVTAVPRILAAGKDYPWDGKVDWISARAFWAGTNPYSPEALHEVKLDGLGHPPTTGFWYLPFAKYELTGVNSFNPITGIISSFLLLLGIAIVSVELKFPAPWATAAAFTFGLLCTDFVYYHLYLSQISIEVGLLFVVGWLMLRRGEDFWCGAALGLGCTIKFYPGLVVFLFLVLRRWRVVLGAMASWGVIAIIMTSRFGIIAWWQYFKSEPIIADYFIGKLANASIFGVVLRFFRASCTGASIRIPAASALAIVAALVIVQVATANATRAIKRGATLDLAYATFVTLSVFLNPFTFEHYFVLELFPALLAASALYRARSAGLSTRHLVAGASLLFLCLVFICLPMGWKETCRRSIYVDHHHLFLHVLEYTNWLHLPLLAGLLATLHRWSSRHAPRLMV